MLVEKDSELGLDTWIIDTVSKYGRHRTLPLSGDEGDVVEINRTIGTKTGVPKDSFPDLDTLNVIVTESDPPARDDLGHTTRTVDPINCPQNEDEAVVVRAFRDPPGIEDFLVVVRYNYTVTKD